MKNKNFTHTIQLLGGYTDKKDVVHTEVTFGKRLSVGDLINIADNPQARLNTQHEELVRRQMITKFGTVQMPISLSALLSLDSIDRQDLDRAQDAFAQNSRGDRTSEILDENSVRLAFGFKIADEVYDIVRFGNRLTGNDEVDADRFGFSGIRRQCFLLGRQISQLASSDHELTLDGTVALEMFNNLDMEDLGMLRVGGELAKQFFRVSRNTISKEQAGGESSGSGS